MSSDDGQGVSDPALEKTVSAEEAGVTPGGGGVDGGRLAAGTKLGRYEIVEFIGGGGMGWVYRAKDTELEREVAIKVVQPTVAGPKGRDRLLAEARAMAKLRHRAVVPVFDVGEYAGGIYVAMALVKGGTLHDWMHAEARPWRQVVARFLEAGRGLVAAHAAGIVHRDFKPRNVLLGEGGEVMVADFGIASASADVGEGEGVAGGPRETTSIVGTPAYMAPEQAAGQAVDARADQYSFCVSLWEGLHGQRPQEAETRTQGALLERSPAAPKSRRRVPGWLTDAVARGFAPAPEKRWPTLAALLDRLEQGLGRGRRWLGLGAVAIAGAVVVSLKSSFLAPPPSVRATCDVPKGRIAQVWDAERAQRLTALLTAVDPQRGRERAARAVGAFDQAVRNWGAANVKACRETRIEHLQSEGMLAKRQDCLDRILAKVAAAVVALEGASDAKSLDGRMRVLDDMPVLDTCNDLAKLVEQPAPPQDPEQAREYAALSDELTAIDVDRLIGNVVDHRKRATAAIPRARALGNPRLLARLLDQLASALHNDGEYEEEVRFRKEAIAAAAEAHDDLAVADAWTSLVSTVAGDLGRPEEAATMLLSAEAAVARAGNPARFRYDLFENKVLIARSRGDLAAALSLIDEAVAFVAAAGGRDPGSDLANRMFIATGERAMTLEALGRRRDSIAAYRDTVALVTAKYGPNHAFLSPYLGNLALLHSALGEHAVAVETMRRALAIAEQHFDRSPRLAEMAWALGLVFVQAGRFEDAMPYLERALEMGRATMAPSDGRIADFLSAYGVALVGMGRTDPGIEQLIASIAIYQARKPTESLGMAQTHLGDAQAAARRWNDALLTYEAARATLTQTVGARSAKVAMAKLGPAILWTKRGQWGRALTAIDSILSEPYEDAAGVLTLARFWRAAAMIELKRPPQPAAADVRALVDALHADPTMNASVTDPVDAWVARRLGVAAVPVRSKP